MQSDKYDAELIKTKYCDKVGKTDSMYMVVLYNCSVEELLEFTYEKNQNSTNIKDSYRRGRAKSAYYRLKEFAEAIKKDNSDNNENNVDEDKKVNKSKLNLNLLVMMDVESDIFETYSLNQQNISLLRLYECKNIWLRCSDHYDLKSLYDYLESDKYHNLFRVKNNNVKYIRLGLTKKCVMDDYESSSLNLAEYIESKIKISDTKYLAYGVSSKLAALNSNNSKEIRKRAYDVINYDISDSDAINYIEKMDQSDILDSFERDLDLMQNIKTMDKIIFKKDFTLQNIAKLEKIYIDEKILDKFKNMCKAKSIDISFNMIVIDSSIKDFIEGRELRLMTEFGGVIGVTYY